jgi:hypothetical protein
MVASAECNEGAKMSEETKKTTATWDALLQTLQKEETLTKEQTSSLRTSIQAGMVREPWFVSLMRGVGVWLALLFFNLSLITTALFRNDRLLLLFGALMALGASAASRWSGTWRRSVFFQQLLIALGLNGIIFLFLGMGRLEKDAYFLRIALLAGVLFLLHLDHLHRRMCALALGGALVLWAVRQENLLFFQALMLFFGAAVFGLGWLRWEEKKIERAERWLGNLSDARDALLLGFSASLFLCAVVVLEEKRLVVFSSVSAIFLLSLCVIFGILLFREAGRSWDGEVAVIGGGLVLCGLAAYNAPGLAASALVFMIGFSRRQIFLAVGALGFLVYYIIFFYYNLTLTLLVKSLSLMAVGILFLLLWQFIEKTSPSEKGETNA